MAALYAFFRRCDDLADEPGEPSFKRAALDRWRTQLDDATRGTFTHRTHAALADTLTRYAVPVEHLHAVLDGVTTDLEPRTFTTFDVLYPYCYRVASAVGLACVPVWGLQPGADPATAAHAAEAAGIAFQLTNILRDFAEDRASGRVYLPTEDFTRFGVTPAETAERRPAFEAFLRFQIDRAEDYYVTGATLAPLLSPEGQRIFAAMLGLYRSLLRKIARDPLAVLTHRVRLSKPAKLAVLATSRAAWAARESPHLREGVICVPRGAILPDGFVIWPERISEFSALHPPQRSLSLTGNPCPCGQQSGVRQKRLLPKYEFGGRSRGGCDDDAQTRHPPHRG